MKTGIPPTHLDDWIAFFTGVAEAKLPIDARIYFAGGSPPSATIIIDVDRFLIASLNRLNSEVLFSHECNNRLCHLIVYSQTWQGAFFCPKCTHKNTTTKRKKSCRMSLKK